MHDTPPETINATRARRPSDHDAPPERVLFFGTGAFLRGFAAFFVEQANRTGVFPSRVVMVGSTGGGRPARLNAQGGRYTLLVRGRQDGQVVEAWEEITAVGRALAASEAWDDVLACAHNPHLAAVVSNTTEVGIVLDEEDRPDARPPRSFPGKLTAFLFERARAFDYDPTKGLVVLPCELLDANGDRLRAIVRTLAERWALGARFTAWLDEANRFCNTLVDRIVPGEPGEGEAAALRETLGWEDDLLTVAEPYRLWVVEGDDALKARLPLLTADPGIVVAPDRTPYVLRKVRLLNGTHTLMVPAALLCGLRTVGEAVAHPLVGPFVRRLLRDELVPGLAGGPAGEAAQVRAYADDVLERFANPFVRHALLDITLQQTAKLKVRAVPSLVAYAARYGAAPPSVAFALACFLLFQHPAHHIGGGPTDAALADWRARWEGVDPADPAQVLPWVRRVLGDAALWGTRLDDLPGCAEAVAAQLVRAAREGVPAALAAHLQEVEG